MKMPSRFVFKTSSRYVFRSSSDVLETNKMFTGNESISVSNKSKSVFEKSLS